MLRICTQVQGEACSFLQAAYSKEIESTSNRPRQNLDTDTGDLMEVLPLALARGCRACAD